MQKLKDDGRNSGDFGEERAMTTGFIPQSSALSEAKQSSLAELMSLGPEEEGFLKNLPRIVEVLREQRARFAESEGKGKRGGGGSLQTKIGAKPLQTSVEVEGEIEF